jgi:hypothetical protein
MFKNYLTIAFRTLRKNYKYTFINVGPAEKATKRDIDTTLPSTGIVKTAGVRLDVRGSIVSTGFFFGSS